MWIKGKLNERKIKKLMQRKVGIVAEWIPRYKNVNGKLKIKLHETVRIIWSFGEVRRELSVKH